MHLRKKREAIFIIEWGLQNQPFKNREHVKAEIRLCTLACSVLEYLSFLFAALGIIGDALNTTLILEPMSWFLLAIFASVHAIIPAMHRVVAKHLLGIEAESKKE
jgi:hypothetical protein